MSISFKTTIQSIIKPITNIRLSNQLISFLIALVTFFNNLYFSQAHESCGYVEYKVLQGETLSQILYDKMKLSPVYGKNGLINKVVNKNRRSVLKKGDLIREGDVLLIPQGINHSDELETQIIGYHQLGPTKQGPLMVVSDDPKITRHISSSDFNNSNNSNDSNEEFEKKIVDVKKANEDSDFRAQVQLGLRYIGIFGIEKTNGSEGRLLTDLVPSFELSWMQYWDPDFTSRFYFAGESVRFISEQSGVNIDHSNVFNSSMGLGLNYQLNSKWNLLTDISVGQNMFYMAIGSRELQINQVPLMSLHPQFKRALIKKGPYELSFFGGVSYYSASQFDTYSINTGYGYNGGIMLSQQFKSVKFSCKLGYMERQQDTTFLKFTEKSIGSNCVLSM